MEIVLNGEKQTVRAETLAALLEEIRMHERRCATMVNGEVVRRPDRAARRLAPGDAVEVISMVGGG